MRDLVVIRRRALLTLAVGIGAFGLPSDAVIARPAQRRPLSAARQTPRIVALDPGHGGGDPGAISSHGHYEKTITLATARELARRLDATGRYRVLLTRRRDNFVGLRERIARARASRAELLLSVHADALPDTAIRGLSVYTLSDTASDRQAAALAIRENQADFVATLGLSRQAREIAPILLDMARHQTGNLSSRLAQAIVDELGRTVPLLDKPHRAAGFVVLTAPEIPSALVELGCLTNPAEERLLAQPGYQRMLAQGLGRAIERYFAADTGA